MSFVRVPLEDFDRVLGTTSTEISSVALGGRILSCSDEWFAPASSLLKVGPAPSLKGQFGPKGALFDGWETRRHCPTYDWVILRLGPKAGGHLVGFDVDTANFNGNEAPEVEIYGMQLDPQQEAQAADNLAENDPRWETLIPTVPCGPSQRHLFALPPAASSKAYTHIKLHMIPDGGIARFRVYGTIPAPPVGQGEGEAVAAQPELNTLDLAHCLNGGRVVFTDDQHFGFGTNIVLPGRGKDMGDGWETRRSRGKGHFNWSIIKLGEAGVLNYAEIDTAHFLGNFPESGELLATTFDGQLPPSDAQWTTILPRTKLGPGRRHFFELANVDGVAYTHVMVKMHPDGGIKRVRIVGRRAAPLVAANLLATALPKVAVPQDIQDPLPSASSDPFAPQQQQQQLGCIVSAGPSGTGERFIAAQPLTSAAFAPYGSVIHTPPSSEGAPFRIVNQGTARKYVGLAPVVNNYPPHAPAKTNVHVYHCDPVPAVGGMPWRVKLLERHRFTTQAFVPMTPAGGAQAGQEGYLVVVALNSKDDKPDLNTLAAFYATTEQAISYHPGCWHHPMIALGTQPTSFACIVNESDVDPSLDCDEVPV
ncbi:related to DAL2 - allantoinase [Pseudozyma flocculosa]|uniref:Related to DAL2 - allantoinase n=1 Tax=Pseudozyma flocculosa TaxID=84751 RepID=A0A5C3EXF6_9BASI|nr:related to DAL2 - allantoinase [Pseudozyma flocculosa]